MEKFFTKTSVLVYIIIALLVFNVATIVFFLSGKKDGFRNNRYHKEMNKGDFIKEKLNLTEEQQKTYDTFNDSFRLKGKAIMDSMQILRMEMLNTITAKNPDTAAIEELNRKFGDLHVQLKRNTIDFYFRMREICTTSQQDSLKNIFTRMLQFEGGRKPFKRHSQRPE